MHRTVLQDGRVKQERSGLCTDCENDFPPAHCHQGEAEFVRGYDQAAREVMSEVKKRDPSLYAELIAEFPSWDLMS